MDPYQLQQRVAELEAAVQDREDHIQQLHIEAAGAAQAIQAARAAQAAAVPNVNHESNPVERILKSLQTPQIIRDLPSFDGNPIKLHSFIKAVDNLIPLLEAARDTPVYRAWIQAIRTKIQGEADNVLELYGTNLDWPEIKNNLITHYSDRRDEVSLSRDLFKLHQTTTVEFFYGEVCNIISLLINLLNLSTNNEEVKTAKSALYQEMGLKVFLAGLKEPLGPIIRAQSPNTLKEALRLCLEERNYNYVKNPFKQLPVVPPRPPATQYRTFQQPPHSYQPPLRNFAPSNQMIPIPHPPPKPFSQRFPLPPPRNLPPYPNAQPQPRPVPMEVDPSIRSRQINYINRPGPSGQFRHGPPRFRNEELRNTEHGEYESYFYFYPPSEPMLDYTETEQKDEPIQEILQSTEETEGDNLNYQIVMENPPAT